MGAVENRGRLASSWSSRSYRWFGSCLAAAGVAAIVFTVLAGGWTGYLSGGGLLMSSAGAFVEARQRRRRERLGGDQAPPTPGDDALALVGQGRETEAVRCYRKLHPGTGLTEVQGLIDDCTPGGHGLGSAWALPPGAVDCAGCRSRGPEGGRDGRSGA
jgi:hypothetical protein